MNDHKQGDYARGPEGKATFVENAQDKPLSRWCDGCGADGVYYPQHDYYFCAKCGARHELVGAAEAHLQALLKPLLAFWLKHWQERGIMELRGDYIKLTDCITYATETAAFEVLKDHGVAVDDRDRLDGAQPDHAEEDVKDLEELTRQGEE